MSQWNKFSNTVILYSYITTIKINVLLFLGKSTSPQQISHRQHHQHDELKHQCAPHEADGALHVVGIGLVAGADLGAEHGFFIQHDGLPQFHTECACAAGEQDACFGIGPSGGLVAPAVGGVFEVTHDGEGGCGET